MINKFKENSKIKIISLLSAIVLWTYVMAIVDPEETKLFEDIPVTITNKNELNEKNLVIYPEKNLRAYPGVERGSQEWEDTYKIRVNVEKSINHFKDSFCITNRKTQNEQTLHADLLLAGITQFVTVLVADKIHQQQYIRSLKPLIA